jgi:hypothetical protein
MQHAMDASHSSAVDRSKYSMSGGNSVIQFDILGENLLKYIKMCTSPFENCMFNGKVAIGSLFQPKYFPKIYAAYWCQTKLRAAEASLAVSDAAFAAKRIYYLEYIKHMYGHKLL